MAEFLYNLLNSGAFWFLAALWSAIGIFWFSRLNGMIERLKCLVRKPVIYETSDDDIPFYPRKFLEWLADALKNKFSDPLSNFISSFSMFIEGQYSIVYTSDKKLRTFAYLFFLIGVILFGYADAVAIANSLQALGLIGTLPILLLQYGVAVGSATFLSVIVGFIVFGQSLSTKSDLTHWDEVHGPWKATARVISIFVIIFGILTGVGLGLSRLIDMGIISGSDATQLFVQLGANVLVIVNGTLGASLIFPEGLRGALMPLIFVQWLFKGIFMIVNELLKFFGASFPFLLDVLWRIVYIPIDIVIYFLITPLMAIAKLFQTLIDWIKRVGTSSEQSD